MRFLRSQLRLGLIANEITFSGDADPAVHWKQILDAGVTSVFLRKTAISDTGPFSASELRELCGKLGRYFFIVDDALLAMQLDADGLFLSKLPKNLARIREAFGPERFLGMQVSTVLDVESLKAENSLGICDFYGVGPVFRFGTKQMGEPLGLDVSRSLSAQLKGAPSFWMGGIRPEDIGGFGSLFADGIAVSRTLEGAGLKEIQSLHSLLAKSLGPSVYSAGVATTPSPFRYTELTQEDLKNSSVPQVTRTRRGFSGGK